MYIIFPRYEYYIKPTKINYDFRKSGGKCRRSSSLLLTEGHAVGALIHGGVSLVGADENAIQRAVVCVLAMVSALTNSTLDTLVGMAIHIGFLL